MRLLELRLLAFGAFSGETLNFERPENALHIVYGPNEAGKSTALRATRALLFGVPSQTSDAYRHGTTDLRVGGRLAAADGEQIEIVRRKGTKNTLLTPEGTALAEGVLEKFLAGVSEGSFVSMYGLTHESLRAGGEALLRGQGDVGGTLFDAARGGRSVADVLQRLRKEADDLYRPRARKAKIKQASEEFRLAQRKLRELALKPQLFTQQTDELEAARRERERLTKLRRQLRTEQQRLGRIQRAAPLIAERVELAAEQARLLAGPQVAPGTRASREQAQRRVQDAEREQLHVLAEQRRLEQRLSSLPKEQSLSQVPQESIDDVRERLGSHRKAQLDLPKRRAEQRALEERARQVQRALGQSGAIDAAEQWIVDKATQGKLRKLAFDHGKVEQALAETRRRLSELRARSDAAERQLSAVRSQDEASQVAALVERYEAARFDEELAALAERCSLLESTLEQKTTVLGMKLPGEQLARLALPTQEAVELALARERDLGRDTAAQREQLARLSQKQRELESELTFLNRDGEALTEERLAELRSQRNVAFERLRAAATQGAPASEQALLEAQFREALDKSDTLADRMRREAERINRHALLVKELADVTAHLAELERVRLELDQRRAGFEHDWRAAWQALPGVPGHPQEMLGFLRRFAELQQLAAELATARLKAERREAESHAQRVAIAEALARANVTTAGFGPDLLRRARQWVDAAVRAAREVEDLGRSLRESEAERQALAQLVREREAELAKWHEEWAEAVAALGLDADVPPEAALSVLDGFGELSSIAQDIEQMRRRVLGIERDADNFGQDVRLILAAHVPELLGRGLAEAASELVQRYDAATKADTERRHLAQELAERARAHDALQQRVQEAREELKTLCSSAGVETLEELVAAEERSLRLATLRQRLRELDLQLFDLGAGASLEALVSEVGEQDAATLRVRLTELEEELREIDERHQAATHRVGVCEAGLVQLDASTGAAEAAADAEAALALLGRHVARYARLRLATRLLDRELERYREQNQGPIISRANELFPLLTLQRYAGLRAEYDASDRAVLRCLRSNGDLVGVEALSDGARDQLYLALRLATLERQARLGMSFPFILDDVFVHFDDERTRVALELLGGMANVFQPIVFTHHARVVELGRQVLPAERLMVHELAQAEARH